MQAILTEAEYIEWQRLRAGRVPVEALRDELRKQLEPLLLRGAQSFRYDHTPHEVFHDILDLIDRLPGIEKKLLENLPKFSHIGATQ